MTAGRLIAHPGRALKTRDQWLRDISRPKPFGAPEDDHTGLNRLAPHAHASSSTKWVDARALADGNEDHDFRNLVGTIYQALECFYAKSSANNDNRMHSLHVIDVALAGLVTLVDKSHIFGDAKALIKALAKDPGRTLTDDPEMDGTKSWDAPPQ